MDLTFQEIKKMVTSVSSPLRKMRLTTESRTSKLFSTPPSETQMHLPNHFLLPAAKPRRQWIFFVFCLGYANYLSDSRAVGEARLQNQKNKSPEWKWKETFASFHFFHGHICTRLSKFWTTWSLPVIVTHESCFSRPTVHQTTATKIPFTSSR